MKNKKIIIITLILIISMTVTISILAYQNNNRIVYKTTFYYPLGSRRIIIYNNGKVYDDLEVEEPNHKTNYKLIKTLTREELDDLKNKINNNNNDTELEDYVKEVVYGTSNRILN